MITLIVAPIPFTGDLRCFPKEAIEWLEEKKRLPPGTSSKYLEEVEIASRDNDGMMNWGKVFDNLPARRKPQGLYREALGKVKNLMREYACSFEKGAFHQILHQTQNI
ncbi:hypothetical protein OS493_030815 [Desmophyllum pertusum]|uniref:Uncharacterized protein n=1 Tax=Desmophyllum pertusum TaxID=174260 RepID=A0A9X0CI16_9CNID|nr:hypothetical protein OS493_030815 [Desmophyllum pertusum]